MPKAQNSDPELVSRYRGGDESAFEEIVAKYKERAFWIAFNITNHVEEAKDISQEAFIRVFRSLRRFDPNRNFYTWFYRIVVNLCIDFLRKKGSGRAVNLEEIGEVANPGGRPEAPLEAKELQKKVRCVLESMPGNYKTVLALRDIHGFSCKEISRIMKCSHATVRWRLHRARKVFREIWEIRFREREYTSHEVQ